MKYNKKEGRDMKRKIIALLLGVSMVITACGQTGEQAAENESQQIEENSSQENTETQDEAQKEDKQQEETSQQDENKEQADNQEAEIEITYKTENSETTASDGTIVGAYDYTYPIVTIKGNETASAEIAKDQEERKKAFIEEALKNQENGKSDYEEMDEEQVQEIFQSYDDYASYQVERQDEKILSFSYNSWYYGGGAHGNSYTSGLNYDVKTGKVLTFEDIFENKENGLAEVKEYILEQCQLPYYSERLSENYENYIDDVITDEFWYFAKEGIHVVSNEYMLSSYASGSFEFVVPYDRLTELKEEYKEELAYIYPVLNGDSVEMDLDSDGQADSIFYDVITTEIVENENTEEEIRYEGLASSLIINGEDLSEKFMELTNYYPENITEHYYLIDLDENDDFIEIAITDYGMSDYHVTNFLRYDKGQLKYVGYINDMLENTTCTFEGDGTLKAQIHSQLMETAKFDASYHLEGEELILDDQAWYYYDRTSWTEEYMQHNILKEVTVYGTNDTTSEKTVLTPADGPVTFPATDNKNWVQVKTASGEIYFIHMNGFTEVDNDGVTEQAEEIFENLFLAG